MTMPGLASTALFLIIFSWNEAFWSINLSNANAQPLTMFIASYSSPGRAFLSQALSGVFSRSCSDHDARLADAKAARARPTCVLDRPPPYVDAHAGSGLAFAYRA